MESSSLHATRHGQKRLPEDELEHDQRLAKRFNLLNLEHDASKLYIPVRSESTPKSPTAPRRRRSNAVTEQMPVDETKDRVYIHDLDEELADIEDEEERLIFLPDIEKRLMKVPKAVLIGESQALQGTEVVLYKLPESLSVPEERDVVRKAIAETRARAQEEQDRARQKELMPDDGMLDASPAAPDEDAMDIG